MANKKGTTVVPYVNVSSRQDLPIPLGMKSRGAGRKSLYCLNALKTLAASPQNVTFATRDSLSDSQKYKLDETKIAQFILNLGASNYRKSEWCTISRLAVAPCDVYCITVVEESDYEYDEQFWTVEYYLKFFITKNGKLISMVSNHL